MVVTGTGGRGTRSAGRCSFATLIRSVKKSLVYCCDCRDIWLTDAHTILWIAICSLSLHDCIFSIFQLWPFRPAPSVGASTAAGQVGFQLLKWKKGVVLDLKDQFLVRNGCLKVERLQIFVWNCGYTNHAGYCSPNFNQPCWLANTSRYTTARQIREHRENLAIAAEADWDGNGVRTDIIDVLKVPVTGWFSNPLHQGIDWACLHQERRRLIELACGAPHRVICPSCHSCPGFVRGWNTLVTRSQELE